MFSPSFFLLFHLSVHPLPMTPFTHTHTYRGTWHPFNLFLDCKIIRLRISEPSVWVTTKKVSLCGHVFIVITLKLSFLFFFFFLFSRGVCVCVCACQLESKYLCRSSGEGQGQSMTDSLLGNKDTHRKADSRTCGSTRDGEKKEEKKDTEDTDKNISKTDNRQNRTI